MRKIVKLIVLLSLIPLFLFAPFLCCCFTPNASTAVEDVPACHQHQGRAGTATPVSSHQHKDDCQCPALKAVSLLTTNNPAIESNFVQNIVVPEMLAVGNTFVTQVAFSLSPVPPFLNTHPLYLQYSSLRI